MGKKKKKRIKKSERQKQIIEPRKNLLLLPPTTLIKPMSQFDRRMLDFICPVPQLGSPEASRLQKLMEMDVAFQLKLKELKKRLPHLVNARMMGGSGLPLSDLLRYYFLEYLNRFLKYGPESFPTSFNVVESFMAFNHEYWYFDLRDEIEHLLSINDYFRWYDNSNLPQEPRILEDILIEGTVYSYNMISEATGFRICGDSQQVFAGVSLIRHKYELSCLLLAGEKPPLHSDEDILLYKQHMLSTSGRENIVAAPDLTIQDRFLDGYPGFAKVIVLTRFDLRAGKHDVRYVNLDDGCSFTILTDDSSTFEDVPPENSDKFRQAAVNDLKRYDDLFAALSSLIYLPAFFAAHPERIQELEVTTKLHAMREAKWNRQTMKVLGRSQCVTHRRIHCLPLTFGIDEGSQRNIKPPDMQFKCDGYWKAIGPQEIGEDKNGNPIVGHTWVARHESWSARSPQSFILQRGKTESGGPDPGIIYIQRSPALEINVYKIGLTRRSAEIRAKELSSATGIPLPFDVLANWEVDDCAHVEQEIHQRLAVFRINPQREFFRAELSFIIKTIDTVATELSKRE